MAHSVVWTPEASGELMDAGAYIALHSERPANLFVRRVLDAARDLGVFPLHGHVVEDLNMPSIREIPVRGFRLVYRVRSKEIRVLAFFRGSREFPARLKGAME